MRWRRIILCLIFCLALTGCGKKMTEYEKAKQNENALSQSEKQYLEKYWYGSWQMYYSDTGEFDEKEHVIDEKLYDGTRPYVIRSVSAENDYIEYELFDMDTGKSEGLWTDTISVDNNIETIYTDWEDERFGGTSVGVLIRKLKK